MMNIKKIIEITKKSFSRNVKKPVVALTLPLALFPYNNAQAQVTIAVSATVDLNFGSLTETGGGGTLTVNTAGARAVTGTVTDIAGAGFESQAMISVSGSTGLAIELSLAAGPYTVSNGGGDTMVVNNFNLATVAGGSSQTITLAVATEIFPMGATLVVSAGQAAGVYTGSYSIVANYQ